MALTTIVDAIAALVASVPNIGQVKGYWEHIENEAELAEKYRAGGIIHAWVVTREATGAKYMSSTVVKDAHKIVITGIRSVEKDPDSEQRHQDMAEAVRAKLNANHHLPGDVGVLTEAAQVEDFGAAKFAGFGLCWYAKLSVIAEERTVPV